MKRNAIAMIELIFAIVVIAISVLTIPSMMRIADQHAKMITVDDDVVSRLLGWTKDKFQARWDQNYLASNSPILRIDSVSDLNCTPGGYRENNQSIIPCSLNAPSSIIPYNPADPTSADGNLSRGVEQLHCGTETLKVIATGGNTYDINATYRVSYEPSGSNLTAVNAISTTWTLGSSDNLGNCTTTSATNATHLKRVVTQFYNPDLQTYVVLTFFKSNKGN